MNKVIVLSIVLLFVLIFSVYSKYIDNKKIDVLEENISTSKIVSSMLETKGLPKNPNLGVVFKEENLKDLYLAGGCFWGLEAYMSRVYGVYDVTSGYANGSTENPSYDDLIYNNSGHAETVCVSYDPDLVSINELLMYYFKVIDPTTINRQGNDIGTQYRTGIYYTDEEDKNIIIEEIEKEQKNYNRTIMVEILPLEHYYLAEKYHQDYLDKNPNGYCHINLNLANEKELEFEKPLDSEIKENLTKLQYEVTQNKATERPFDNDYWDNYEPGIYVDIVTGEPLFSSKNKFESGSGWPSFTKPISEDIIKEVKDNDLFTTRVEVRSVLGDSHLGHVFNDGPENDGGLRYCINSASLNFIPLLEMDKRGYGSFKYLVK